MIGTILRRLTALGLAIIHAALLWGTGSLHSYGSEREELDLDDLPAQYHHHAFRLIDGGEEPLPPHDDCLGCLLQRAVGPPLGPVTGLFDGTTGASRAQIVRSVVPTPWRDDPLSRAPPV